jgi:hypothetical protein
MTTGRINQVTLLSATTDRKANHPTYVNDSPAHHSHSHTSTNVSIRRGMKVIDKVKRMLGNSPRWRTKRVCESEPPDSLALSMFHYTDNVEADSLIAREPRRANSCEVPVAKASFTM